MAVPSEELRPLYAVLGVEPQASEEAIKIAYRRLALAYHPDKHQSQRVGASDAEEASTKFARIAFAYEVLGNTQRRKRYDLTGEVPQSDAALGRKAGETFLAEYVRAAPKAPRGISQKDMSLHSLENYEVLEVEGRDVPAYMRGIVMQGLGYLVRVVHDMELKEVVLLRHYVMDQMYALLVYTPPLDEDAFSERGYIITYYDHPLQSGIRPSWSDQNDGRPQGNALADLKNIDPETFRQRQLAALEWHGPAPQVSSQASAAQEIPGEGLTSERISLAVRALVKVEQNVESWDVHRVRRSLEKLLRVEPNALDDTRATEIMMHLFSALEEEEDEPERAAPESHSSGPPAASGTDPAASVQTGAAARVKASGRVGQVLLHDPADQDLTYKLHFTDGAHPEIDWFGAGAVEPALGG